MDDVGETGYSCSIDVNNIGEPAIAYYAHSLGDLKFAYTDLFVIPSWPYSIWLPVVGKN
jgi:hypothetical protein